MGVCGQMINKGKSSLKSILNDEKKYNSNNFGKNHEI